MKDMQSTEQHPPGSTEASGSSSVEAAMAEECRIGGLAGELTGEFDEELRCLLRRRLRNAALVLFGGFAAFLIRDLLLFFRDRTVFDGADASGLLVTFSVVTLIIAVIAGLLSVRSCFCLTKLRWFELALFGITSGFTVYLQYWHVCSSSPILAKEVARAFPSETILPWIVLIQVYGLYIPSQCRRAAAVIALFVAAPLVVAATIIASNSHPEIADTLTLGGFSSMVLWLCISAVTAIYGSHRVGRLRREAFDARRIGSYTLLRRIGVGGMGEVYVAEHRLLKRPCAIKLIRPEKAMDPNSITRFEREVQAAARLTHPNTIEIYDYGYTDDGRFYYAMELLPGLSLQETVDRFGPLPPERLVYLLRQVCSALTEAHRKGLVHRDIKPGNIFAAERGGLFDVAKLLDFGLVKSLEPDIDSLNVSVDGAVIGSPLYSPPEAVKGTQDFDARSDIYSLGATAYFALTGQPVFTGEKPLQVLFAHAQQVPKAPTELRPDLPDDLEAIVMRCLAKDPEDRFETAEELDSALSMCGCASVWSSERAAAWWAETNPAAEPFESQPVSDEHAVTDIINIPM